MAKTRPIERSHILSAWSPAVQVLRVEVLSAPLKFYAAHRRAALNCCGPKKYKEAMLSLPRLKSDSGAQRIHIQSFKGP